MQPWCGGSAADFIGGTDEAESLPFSGRLAQSSTVFTHAVSPSTWTLPSHASMLTGLYPWEHLAFGGDWARLSTGTKTVASILSDQGYATACLSANPYVSPSTGLTHGFEFVRWGDWFDCSARPLSRWFARAHEESCRGSSSGSPLGRIPFGVRVRLNRFIRRYPILADVFFRAAAMALAPGQPRRSVVAPWIEDTFARWLASVDPGRPLFCLINLLDAHEPYIGLPEQPSDYATWFRMLTASQSERAALGSSEQRVRDWGKRLRDLYRACLPILDRRINTLADHIRRIRDWENAVVVVTSDHGQSFGEDGTLFHGRSWAERVHRVPLIVKPALASPAANIDRRWVSTKDVWPLMAASAHLPFAKPLSDSSRGSVISTDVATCAVYCQIDNPTALQTRKRGGRNQVSNGHESVASYSRGIRCVADVDSDSLEIRHLDQYRPSAEEQTRVVDRLRDVASLLRGARDRTYGPKPQAGESGPDARLLAWGYE
jgi:arylsulfatase A-like enzyme